jgi:protein TonB
MRTQTLLIALTLVAIMATLSAQALENSNQAPMKVGGEVLPPVLIHSVDPKYPRPLFGKAKPSSVLIGLVVTDKGDPAKIYIVRSGGDKFDKNALDAVRQYHFKPAMLHGEAVPVEINIEVQYKIF